jgi:hypothetical protein
MAAIALTQCISNFQNIRVFEGTLDPAAIPYATAAMAEQDLTITGVLSTDKVLSFYATDQVTFGIGNARVKAANTVAVIFVATDTDTAVDPAGTINYRLVVVSE